MSRMSPDNQQIDASNPGLIDTAGDVEKALALCRKGEWSQAESMLRTALNVRPYRLETAANLGAVLVEVGRYDDARSILMDVLERDNRFVPAIYNLGNIELAQGNYSTAITWFRQVNHLQPNWAPAFSNLGQAMRLEGRLSEASSALTHALALDNNDAFAHYNLALVRLTQGRFAEAWPHYEWRIMQETGRDYIYDPRQPSVLSPRPSRWLRENGGNQRVLVVRDQGLGDELFFLRFVHSVKRHGDDWTYLTSSRLAPIARQCNALDRVVTGLDEHSRFDRIISVGDLPQLFNNELPLPLPLTVNPNIRNVLEVNQFLSHLPRPYLGLSWRAGTEPTLHRPAAVFKQVDLAKLAASLMWWSGTIVVVQRGPQPDELHLLNTLFRGRVADCSALNDDLENMTALLSLLDTYVGVSNTNTHLWAGMNRRCHVLVPQPGEWRWMAQGECTPWFPLLNVYRQTRSKAWDGAMDELNSRLRPEFQSGIHPKSGGV